MLTFNNKILTVSNKGLEVAAGPTPPAPGPELLYTQAVASYTETTTYSDYTLMAAQTWDTNKNFICYKISVCITPNSHSGQFGRCVLINGGNYQDARFGRIVNSTTGYVDVNSAYASGLYYNEQTYETLGSDGVYATAKNPQSGTTSNVIISNPNTLMSNSSQTEFKVIFDKLSKKLYIYIEGKQVVISDYSTLNIDPSTWPVTTRGTSSRGTYNFGIDVYACDTLTDAEGV